MFFLPSLARPGSVGRFLEAYRDTGAIAPVVIWVGTDDPFLEEYERLDYPDSVRLHIDRPMRVGQAMQAFYNLWPNESMYGYLADDVVPRSEGWDQGIESSCGDWNFVTVNEGLPQESMDEEIAKGLEHFAQKRWYRQPAGLVNSNFPMVGGELVRALGGFMPVGIQHFETDVFWQRVAITIGVNQYRPDIVLEHMHHAFGKSEMDSTYQRYRPDNEGSDYWGWQLDLLTHLSWWCGLDNLKRLDQIKLNLHGEGFKPEGPYPVAALEQLRRMHVADRELTVKNLYTRTLDDMVPKLEPGCHVEERGGFFYLRYKETDSAHHLNFSAALVLTHCDGCMRVKDIVSTVHDVFSNEDVPTICQHVRDSIDQWYQFGILDLCDAPADEDQPEFSRIDAEAV